MAEGEKRTRTNYGISAEQFRDTWQASATAQEAADKLSQLSGRTVPKNIVLARAAVYRQKGVNLKKMPRQSPRRLDVTKLNEGLGTAPAAPPVEGADVATA